MKTFKDYLEAVINEQALSPYTLILLSKAKAIVKKLGKEATVKAVKDGAGFRITLNGKYLAHSESPIKDDELKKKIEEKLNV